MAVEMIASELVVRAGAESGDEAKRQGKGGLGAWTPLDAPAPAVQWLLMPELLTQADVRPARHLPFCYLCGKPIPSRHDNHPDHVPPEAIFEVADRNFPLKVAAHLHCNRNLSDADEVIGQLIAVIHGKHPRPDRTKLRYEVFKIAESEVPFLAIPDTGLPGQVARWVRGFHAALYHEFMPVETRWDAQLPFPSGRVEQDGYTIDKVLPQHPLFVELIKKNRAAGRLDRVVCNNGKCHYECVWIQMDDGARACVFALRLYDWSALADSAHFERRGCVGWYQPAAGPPPSGTTWTTLDVPFSNRHPLDPFGN